MAQCWVPVLSNQPLIAVAVFSQIFPKRGALFMSGLQRSQSLAIDLDVRPLAGRIGAQIDSIRLAGDLPDATIAAIEAALSKYKVIFFRDQGHLDDAEQERFAARLGDLVSHPTSPARPGSAAILELDSTDGRGRADRWHTDLTFFAVNRKSRCCAAFVFRPSA